MKEYKFKQWFKYCFEYEDEVQIVTIRDYDYRDGFLPVITQDFIDHLIVDGSKVEYINKQ